MFANIFLKLDNLASLLFLPKRVVVDYPPNHILKDSVEQELSLKEKKLVAALMRINHCGEICAQGLYEGQASASKSLVTKNILNDAALEEYHHLIWCDLRLRELSSRPSILIGFFYINSFLLGTLAGSINDKISFGFLSETEIQVSKHLVKHLLILPAKDWKTHAILMQMLKDETKHAEMAQEFSQTELPIFLKYIMQIFSKIMTSLCYYI